MQSPRSRRLSQLTRVNRLIPVTWLVMNSKLFYLLSLIWSARKTYEVIWLRLNGAYNRSLAKAWGLVDGGAMINENNNALEIEIFLPLFYFFFISHSNLPCYGHSDCSCTGWWMCDAAPLFMPSGSVASPLAGTEAPAGCWLAFTSWPGCRAKKDKVKDAISLFKVTPITRDIPVELTTTVRNVHLFVCRQHERLIDKIWRKRTLQGPPPIEPPPTFKERSTL